MTYVYFGHHKCASTWIREIIEQVLRESGHRSKMVFDPRSPHDRSELTDYYETFPREELVDYVERHGLDFLSCISADAEQAASLFETKKEPIRGIHVIRDPRDIIVSGYFSHRNSHPVDGLPHLAAHRESLRSVSKEEGLFLEIDFSAQLLHDIGTWAYDQEWVLELKMEDLTARPYEGFLEIFEFLGLMSWNGAYRMREKTAYFVRTALNRLSRRHPLLDVLRRPVQVTGDMLLGQVYDHRFEKKANGRKVGEADASSHYRKGIPGDWVNHFRPAHTEYFIELFGDLLTITGYESEPWTVRQFEMEQQRHAMPLSSESSQA